MKIAEVAEIAVWILVVEGILVSFYALFSIIYQQSDELDYLDYVSGGRRTEIGFQSKNMKMPAWIKVLNMKIPGWIKALATLFFFFFNLFLMMFLLLADQSISYAR